jgi:nucleotide-binding universal stress UspA family protein
MFNHILVPLDGSPLAEITLPHLAALSNPGETRVTLVRVLEVTGEQSAGQPVDPFGWRMNRAEAQSYLDQLVTPIAENTGLTTIDTRLLEGDPAQRIIEFARQNAVDLILLSSHGKSGVSRWNVSSVVRKIIQNANLSIMLVRAYDHHPVGEEGLTYKRILVPLDGSLRAEIALPQATVIAQKHNAQLYLAHVLHKPEIVQRVPPNEQDQGLFNQVVERSRAAAETYMDQLTTRLPVPFERELRTSNNVFNTLDQIITDRDIDLVIMSAHGHSADTHRTFGNITSGLIEYGATSLLTIQDLSPEEVGPTRAEEAARERRGH